MDHYRPNTLATGAQPTPQDCGQVSSLAQLNSSPHPLDPTMLSQWFRTPGKPRGAVLSIHGLNGHPQKIANLAQDLTHRGYDVLNVALPGHRGNLEAMRSLNYSTLYQHAQAHLCLLLQSLEERGNILVLLAHSTGAILQGNLLYHLPFLTQRKVKALWLAPAFKLRRIAQLSQLLSGRWILPSFSPRAYRANRGTSFNGYQALRQARQEFDQHFAANPRLLPPTLIIMSPQDELIDFPRTQKFFIPAPQVRFTPISNSDSLLPGNLHHLIVDRMSLGATGYRLLQQRLTQFLGPLKPSGVK